MVELYDQLSELEKMYFRKEYGANFLSFVGKKLAPEKRFAIVKILESYDFWDDPGKFTHLILEN